MQSPLKSTFQIHWHNQTPLLNVEVASFSIKLSEATSKAFQLCAFVCTCVDNNSPGAEGGTSII